MKKLLAILSAPLAAVSTTFAENLTSYIDLTSIEGVANELGTEVQGLLTGQVLTAVCTILGGVVVVWAVGLIWKWVKHIAGR